VTDDDDSDGPRLFRSRAAGRDALARLALVVALLVGVTVAVHQYAPFLLDPTRLRAFLAGFGSWTPAAFVALQAAQVVVAPIPGQLLGLVAGYLFGGLAGALYSMVGVTLGSAVAIGVSRRYGRPYTERVVDDSVLERFDAIVEEVGVPGLFLMYLLPVFPDDVLCFVAGLTDIPLPRLLALVLVGRAPTFVLVAYLGGSVADSNLAFAALLGVTLLVLAVLGYRRRESLLAVVDERGAGSR
jgi:uncharacterized membrane protein YdjX (TVP38/TMEM64 family)